MKNSSVETKISDFVDTVVKKGHFKSVFDNEQNLLAVLCDIHNGGEMVELDPMFFKGKFYQDGIGTPEKYFDLNPQFDWIPQGDARHLPLEDSSIKSMILDPPFLFGVHGKTKDYYSSMTHTIYQDFAELESNYKDLLKESYRILEKNGLLIFKCQDYTDSKTVMTRSLVYNWATELGFYAKDMAILVKPNKITNPNTTQRHLRKIHTYFWVFVKKDAPATQQAQMREKIEELLEEYESKEKFYYKDMKPKLLNILGEE